MINKHVKSIESHNIVKKIESEIKLYMQTDEYEYIMASKLLLGESCLFTLPSKNLFDEVYNIEFILDINSNRYIIFIYCDASFLEKTSNINNEKVVFIVMSNNRNITKFNLFHFHYVFWTIPLKDYWLFCSDYRQIQNYDRLLNRDYEIYSHNYNLHLKFDIDQNLLKGSYITFLEEESLWLIKCSFKLMIKSNQGINFSCIFFSNIDTKDDIIKKSSFINKAFTSLGNDYYKMLFHIIDSNFKNIDWKYSYIYYDKNTPCLTELLKRKYLNIFKGLHIKCIKE